VSWLGRFRKGKLKREQMNQFRTQIRPLQTVKDRERQDASVMAPAESEGTRGPAQLAPERRQIEPHLGASDPSQEWPETLVSLRSGHVLGSRYEVKSRLGSGGMGAVFAAFDRVRNENVALKVLAPHLLAQPKAQARFLEEGRIASKLSHPNIAIVHDVQQDGQLYFLTMELLQGSTLREEMQTRTARGARFPINEVYNVAGALCEALVYAHRFMVHRDVKPENVFLCTDGSIKLMDFGIARVLSSSQLTMTGIALGTPYYMAPEQVQGVRDIDHRADQYSVAVVLYEMLTGQVPVGRSEAARKRRRDAPPPLSEAIDRALSPGRGERFRNMSDFAAALRQRRASSHRRRITLGAAVGGAAIVSLGALTAPSWLPALPRHWRQLTLSDEEHTAALQAQAAAADGQGRVDEEVSRQSGRTRALVERLLVSGGPFDAARAQRYAGEGLLKAQRYEDARARLHEAALAFENLLGTLRNAETLVAQEDAARQAAQEWSALQHAGARADASTMRSAEDAMKRGAELVAATDFQGAESQYAQAAHTYTTLTRRAQADAADRAKAEAEARAKADALARAAREKAQAEALAKARAASRAATASRRQSSESSEQQLTDSQQWAGTIQIGNLRQSPAKGGLVTVRGTAANRGDRPTNALRVTIQALDSSGNVVANTIANVPTQRLGPGETASFTAEIEDRPTVKSYHVKAEAR
jgi:serine/threonine protein kinase